MRRSPLQPDEVIKLYLSRSTQAPASPEQASATLFLSVRARALAAVHVKKKGIQGHREIQLALRYFPI